MAVVRTYLRVRVAKDLDSSELLTDLKHGSCWVEGVSRVKEPSQGGAFVTTGDSRTWNS